MILTIKRTSKTQILPSTIAANPTLDTRETTTTMEEILTILKMTTWRSQQMFKLHSLDL